jgi:hypothetical protein
MTGTDTARGRVLAALEGSPEVRPGTAEQLVADLVAETLRGVLPKLQQSMTGHLFEHCDEVGAVYEQLAIVVDAVERKARYGCETPESHNYGCPCEKDTATRGESTRSRLSAMKLAAFIGGAHNGRAMTGSAALAVAEPECDDCGSRPAGCGHCPKCDVCLDCHQCSIGDGCKCRCSTGGGA